MNRSTSIHGPGNAVVTLKFTFRAFFLIERDLKVDLNTLHKQLGLYAGDTSWAELIQKVVAIAANAGRGADRTAPFSDDEISDILDCSIERLGREGLADVVREALERGTTRDGERLPSGNPKATAPAQG